MLKLITTGAAVVIVLILPFGLQWIYNPVIAYNKLLEEDAGRRSRDIYMKSGRSVPAMDFRIEDEGLVDISIVIPAYNEETRLPIMMDSTMKFIHDWSMTNGYLYEVLIVDDGSKDNTVQVAQQYMSQHPRTVRVLKLGENRGKGGAVKRGVHLSRGRYILMADADGATDINDLDRLYTSMKRTEETVESLGGNVGIVVGSRAHLEQKSVATRAWYRTILMKGFHVLVTLLCTRNIRDTQCGFKLFTRQAAKIVFNSLHLERWAFDIELIYVAEMLGIPIREVTVNWHEVEGSKLIETKLDIVKTSLTMARDMLCVRLAYLFGIWRPSS